MKKYSEQVQRHAALKPDGSPCEILERITWETAFLPDGSAQAPVLFNRRFDLKTGERVNRLGETEFEIDGSGLRLHLQR